MKTIVLLGSSGFIGSALLQRLGQQKDFSVIGTYHQHRPVLATPDNVVLRELDITEKQELKSLLQESNPDVVINTVAISTIDACERDKEQCDDINVDPTRTIVEHCQSRPMVKYIFFSTDHVFDGRKEKEYTERDATHPLNYYGKTKELGEQLISSALQNYVIIRPCLVFGWPQRQQRQNLFSTIYTTLKQQKEFRAYKDKIRSPCYLDDLPPVVEQVIRKDKKGLLLVGGETMSLYDFAWKIAEYFHLDQNLIRGIESAGQEEVPRPRNCALDHSLAERELGVRFSPLTKAFQEIKGVLP